MNSNDDYANDILIDQALLINEKKLTPNVIVSKQFVDQFIVKNQKEIQDQKSNSYLYIFIVVLFGMLVFVLIFFYLLQFVKFQIVNPISNLKSTLDKLGEGKLLEENVLIEIKTKEILDIFQSVNKLNNGLKQKIEFTNFIGNNNFDIKLEKQSEDDQMATSLIYMKNSLQQSALKDAHTLWANKGLATVIEILRITDIESSIIHDKVLKFLIDYTNSNQGGLFLFEPEKEILELKACYAYNRKKFLTKTIEIGEGLISECFVEKKPIFITKPPNNYTAINSGLGEATPNCLLLLPLINNQDVEGVIEVASFDVFEEYQIDFLKKVCENIYSFVSTSRNMEKVRSLLSESQQQTEMMWSQEEEMRQNLEELNATQDQMKTQEAELIKNLSDQFERKERKYLDEIAMLKNVITKPQ